MEAKCACILRALEDGTTLYTAAFRVRLSSFRARGRVLFRLTFNSRQSLVFQLKCIRTLSVDFSFLSNTAKAQSRLAHMFILETYLSGSCNESLNGLDFSRTCGAGQAQIHVKSEMKESHDVTAGMKSN